MNNDEKKKVYRKTAFIVKSVYNYVGAYRIDFSYRTLINRIYKKFFDDCLCFSSLICEALRRPDVGRSPKRSEEDPLGYYR